MYFIAIFFSKKFIHVEVRGYLPISITVAELILAAKIGHWAHFIFAVDTGLENPD